MAPGASAGAVQKQVSFETLSLAGIGGVASGILAQGISTLLYGVTANDPLTFTAKMVTLISVAAIAGYLPHAAPRASIRWRRYVPLKRVAPS